MTAPPAEGATDEAAIGLGTPRGTPHVNPATGLSTDYLNHFTEAVMVLEMAATAPDCLDDLRAWSPKSYIEHFASSRFSHRGAVIAAYKAAAGGTRDALDAESAALNATILQIRHDLLSANASPGAEAKARRACKTIRPRIAGMAALINGVIGRDNDSTQSEIDAIFAR